MFTSGKCQNTGQGFNIDQRLALAPSGFLLNLLLSWCSVLGYQLQLNEFSLGSLTLRLDSPICQARDLKCQHVVCMNPYLAMTVGERIKNQNNFILIRISIILNGITSQNRAELSILPASCSVGPKLEFLNTFDFLSTFSEIFICLLSI